MWKFILKSLGEIIGYSIIHPKKARVIYGGAVKGFFGILLYSTTNYNLVKQGIKKFRDKDENFEPLNLTYKEIPMKIDTNNKYLRHTKYIQRDADKIVKLSNSLMNESVDRKDYAEKVFDYVQNEILFGINRNESALGTLVERKAFCYGKLNLMSALLRRQFIETRYKFVPIIIENKIVNFVGSNMDDTTEQLLIKMVNNFMPHAILEININGKWIEADPVIPANLCAYLKYPINKLGDRPVWLEKESLEAVYLPEIPSLYINVLESLADKKIARYVNDASEKGMKLGKEFIERCGGVEEYNKFLLRRYINA